jgi:hypothetical protein
MSNMPFDVPIPSVLRKSGWRAAVYDNEGPETPHVTIRFKTDKMWKVSLRDGRFVVPPGGRWRDIPTEIKAAVEEEDVLRQMRAYWDQQNPHNLVESSDDE